MGLDLGVTEVGFSVQILRCKLNKKNTSGFLASESGSPGRLRRLHAGRSLCDTSTAKLAQVHTQSLPDDGTIRGRLPVSDITGNYSSSFRRVAARSGGQGRGMRLGYVSRIAALNFADVAQMAEQRFCKPKRVGSMPTVGTTSIADWSSSELAWPITRRSVVQVHYPLPTPEAA